MKTRFEFATCCLIDCLTRRIGENAHSGCGALTVTGGAARRRSCLTQSASARKRVRARSVSFRYAEGEPWILKDCSLRIEAGECVAIAGPSGCGKTTLAESGSVAESGSEPVPSALAQKLAKRLVGYWARLAVRSVPLLALEPVRHLVAGLDLSCKLRPGRV